MLFEPTKFWRILFGEIELHGDKNESKKETVENFFFWKELIGKSFKQIAMKWNLLLGSVIRLAEEMDTYHHQLYVVPQLKQRQT